MESLDIYIEKISPNGGIMAKGIKKLLGQPRLTALELLVREATQNSWDARRRDVRPSVRWEINALDHAAIEKLCRTFPGGPTTSRKNLRQALSARPLMLTLVDEGTIGLIGPTRADRVKEGESSNFVSFVRNVGDHSSEFAVSGGLFGYGKSSFYRASRSGMTLVYSRIREGSRLESRFIACMLGDPKSGVHTGRAWWGQMDSTVIEPLTGKAADKLAASLGLALPRGGETGTSVTVLAPTLLRDEDESITLAEARDIARDLAAGIAEAMLWHLWPKMVAKGAQGMDCAVVCLGKSVAVQSPLEHTVIRWFAQAYQAVKSGKDDSLVSTTDIACLRPQQHLGMLGLLGPVPLLFESHDLPESFGPTLNHVAYLRGPELVVKYEKFERSPDAAQSYAGVFVADAAVDAAFAASEPPSHDDWSPSAIEDPEGRHLKSFVKVGLSRIKERVQEQLQTSARQVSASGEGAYGALSQALGGLLFGASGDAPSTTGRPSKGRSGGSTRKQAPFRVAAETRLDAVGDKVYAFLPVEILSADRTIVLRACCRVLQGDGAPERQPPSGAQLTRVVGWVDPHRNKLSDGSDYTWKTGAPKEVLAQFEVPLDAAIALDVVAVESV